MEKNTIFPENYQSEYTEHFVQMSSVPKSFFKMVSRFGLIRSLHVVIGRFRWRVLHRLAYCVSLLRCLQINYYRLKASRVTLWMIRKSIEWSWMNWICCKIERSFNPVLSKNFIESRNSESKKLFGSLYKQFKIY